MLDFADELAVVDKLGLYHGGDVLYGLSCVP
jgi:hypothetical protein